MTKETILSQKVTKILAHIGTGVGLLTALRKKVYRQITELPGFEVLMGKNLRHLQQSENMKILWLLLVTSCECCYYILLSRMRQETGDFWLAIDDNTKRWRFFPSVMFMILLSSTYKALRLGWEEAPGILGWEVLVPACIQMWEARELGRNKVLTSREQSTVRTVWKGDYIQ